MLAVYRVTGPAIPTPHNQYIRLASAFVQGRLDLPESPRWLEVARYRGRTYVIPPPFPACWKSRGSGQACSIPRTSRAT